MIFYSQSFINSCILKKIHLKRLVVSIQAKQLRWQCRRGMLELDMLLMPFIDEAFAALNNKQQNDFKRLLEHEDSELFPWLMLREEPTDVDMKTMVKLVVEHARRTSVGN